MTSSQDAMLDKVPEPFFIRNSEVRELDKVLILLAEFKGVDRLRLKIIEQRTQLIQKLRSSHERMVQRVFPSLIIPSVSESISQRFLSVRQVSVLEGEAIRLISLKKRFKQVGANRLDKEKILFEQYNRQYDFNGRSFEQIELIAKASLESVQRQFIHILNKYIPVMLRQPLQFSDRVLRASYPSQLFEIFLKKQQEGLAGQKIKHEAAFLLTWFESEFRLRLGRYSPELVNSAIAELSAVINQNVFDSEEKVPVTVFAKLDPNDDYHVERKDGKYLLQWFVLQKGIQSKKIKRLKKLEQLSQDPNSDWVKINLSAYPLEDGYVIFDSRRKESIFQKQLRRYTKNPGELTDHMGFTLTVLDYHRTMPAVVYRLRRHVVQYNGQVWSHKSNLVKSGAVDENRLLSSERRRAEKYNFIFRGLVGEIQLLNIVDYINSLFAHSLTRHDLYKAVSYMDTFFPWVWPKEFIPLGASVDFYDRRIRHAIWKNQIHC